MIGLGLTASCEETVNGTDGVTLLAAFLATIETVSVSGDNEVLVWHVI